MSSTKSQVALATNIPTNLASASASASATSTAAAAVVVVAAVASNNSTTSPATGATPAAAAAAAVVAAAATTTTAAQAVTSSPAAATTASTVSTITTQTATSNNNNCSNSSNEDTSSASNLGRQNSFGNRRGNMKGKHLTRSHAMRESTSPPRTPTPRAASEQQQQQHPSDAHEHNNNNNNSNAILNNNNSNTNTNTNTNSKAQSTGRGNSPLMETPAVIVTSQQQQQQQQQQQPPLNVPLRDEQEFPKLSPPKKSGAGQHNRTNSNGSSGIEYNNNNNNSSGGNSSNNNGKKYVVDLKANGLDKHHNNSNNNNNSSNNSGAVLYNSGMNYKAAERHDRHERHEMSSQNSNLSNSNHEEEQYHYERSAGGGGGKKHRANTNSKGSKPRLKNPTGSSSGSIDGNVGGGAAGPGGGGGAAGINNCSGGNSQTLNSNNSSNNTSGFISRVFRQSENSSEQYTDFGGTDLLTFFRDTLNKNPKDRNILLKIEKDLMEFVQDKSRGCEYRFPATSSYNRMLIHRTAAFFGMDHNVDSDTQQCVIVAVTKGTRIPEIRFKSLVRGDHREDARKSILKRDTHSFDEVRQSPYLCPERVMLDRKAKSFEEREEDYDRARSRIFNRTAQQDGYGNEMPNDDCYGGGGGGGWHNAVEQQQQQQQQQQQPPRPKRPNGKMLQMQNSTESRDGGGGMRSGGAVPKSHNFGNYGGPPSAGGPGGGGGGGNSLPRGDSTNSSKSGRGGFAKQDSTGSTSTPWRLSPSSSGYKTRTQSVRSDSVTPSPTGYGSDRQTPEFSQQGPVAGAAQSSSRGMASYLQQAATPIATAATATTAIAAAASNAPDAASASGLVWAVTDISSVPIGSVLIDPQTLQPILNPDGSIYHYDPSNLPPNQALQQHQTGNNGGGGNYQSGGNYYRKSSPHQPPQQSVQQQQQTVQQPQSVQQQVYSNELSCSSTESYAEEVQSPGIECADGYDNYATDSQQQQQTVIDAKGDECDSLSSATGCLSITTSTSTKNYDRIEVQKYKNQATSPNIPACCAADKELEVVAQQPQLQPEPEQESIVVVSANIASSSNSSSSSSGSNVSATVELPQSQTPLPVALPLVAQNCDAQSLSPSSTPYSQCDVKPAGGQSQAQLAVEEPKTTTWGYTFHTTTTPNDAAPYCATTYQQGPDGSIYAVPQGMVYAAYPQPTVSSVASQPLFQLTSSSQPTQTLFASPEGGELPGGTYMIPVFDAAQQQRDSLIPAQAIYQTAAGPATAVMPMATATAYPTAQFAAAAPNGAPIYQTPLIYSSEPAGAQLQQLPMATYPTIGYPYHHYYPIPYYVPQQAVAAAPMVATAAPTQSGPNGGPPGGAQAQAQAAQAAAAAAQLNLATATAAGPSTVATVGGQQANGHQLGASGGYLGGARVKRTPGGGSIHYNPSYQATAAAAAAAHHAGAGATQIISTPGAGGTTTYHALPTLTLAHGGAAANTDLNAAAAAAAAAAGAHVYALPAQHTTALIPTNIFPYAPGQPGGQQATPHGAVLQHQQHHQQQQHHQHQQQHQQQQQAPPQAPHSAPHHALITAAPFYTAASMDAAASQSAPSTPAAPGRQAPLFSTPPAPNGGGGGSGGGMATGGYHSNSSTPHYYHSQSNDGGGGGGGGYVPYEKRNNGGGMGAPAPGRKPYHPGGYNPRHSVPLGGMPAGAKTPLLNSNNEPTPRASPSSISLGGGPGGHSNSSASSYHHAAHRGPPPAMGKRDMKPAQMPLISGPPPSYATSSSPAAGQQQQQQQQGGYEAKPPVRLNAGAASFRSQKSMNADYRRSVSQRNSPSANGNNSSSGHSHESSNNSPNSIQGGVNNNINNNNSSSSNNNSAANTPNANATAANLGTQYIVVDHATGAAVNTSPPSLYLSGGSNAGGGGNGAGPRASHIPAQLHHNAGAAAAAAAAAAGAGGQQAAAVLSGVAALGGYNPNAASGVYIKYGQTYFAHPSVTLPNNRRSPSSDIRPQMAQVTGMYPAAMMIQAPPRHPSRHPNPNYKGSRPR
ncbi:hypothetical protein KR044_009533 [Drosophila immigrans]|nr:hypothetical protein KR044_009533 [Drosophila immigrans]